MKIAACFAIFLACSKEAVSAPVTTYPSPSTIIVQTSIPTSPAASVPASSTIVSASTAGSTGGIFNVLQGLFSAAMSSYSDTSNAGTSTSASTTSTSSTSSVSSSEVNWKSLLGLLFGGLGINPAASSGASSVVSVATSPVSSKQTTANTASANNYSPTLVTLTPSTLQSALNTVVATSTSKSQSSATPTSTSGIYNDIYNSAQDIDQKFAIAILDSHNAYRAAHGVGSLSWSNEPYAYAKKYADSYDCSGVLTHTHGQYGENLAAGFANGPAVVDAWYDEGTTFDYSALNEYNHFTQVVWKDSTKLGCAYKDCTAQGWQLYVICEYDPPGNYIGEEKANVLPLVS